MYKGWIETKPKEKELLESLGIKVGPYNKVLKRYDDCEVPEESLVKLDPYWGQMIWYLVVEAKEETTGGTNREESEAEKILEG